MTKSRTWTRKGSTFWCRSTRAQQHDPRGSGAAKVVTRLRLLPTVGEDMPKLAMMTAYNSAQGRVS